MMELDCFSLLGDVGARPGVSCWYAHEIRSGSGESSNDLTPRQRRKQMPDTVYSTKVSATGGRHGSIRSDDGLLNLKLLRAFQSRCPKRSERSA